MIDITGNKTHFFEFINQQFNKEIKTNIISVYGTVYDTEIKIRRKSKKGKEVQENNSFASLRN